MHVLCFVVCASLLACAVYRQLTHTDLRVDQAGSYILRFTTAFVASFSAISPQPRDIASQVFHVVPGDPAELRVVQLASGMHAKRALCKSERAWQHYQKGPVPDAHTPAGMRSGRVFLRQPVIEVADVGKNRLLEGALAVTAI